MKKLGLLLMPLMTTSFLLGCNGGGGGEKKETYTMTFNGNHCKANNLDTYEKGSSVSFEITPDSYCVLPENKDGIEVEGINEYDYVVSSSGTATFSCTMTTNVTINVTATPKPVNTLYIKKANGGSLPSSIDVGESFEIVAFNKSGVQVDATFTTADETITITSENKKVIITGILGGSATIKCQATGYVTTTRKLEVIPLVMNIKKANGEDLPTSMYAEDEINIAAFDSNKQPVTTAIFSTTDSTITITTKGSQVVVKGISEGYGKITCKAKGYRDVESTIYVRALKIMTIKLDTGEDMPSAIDVSSSIQIAAYEGDTQLTSGVTFSIYPETIATINNNKITGVSAGEATIKCEASGYKDATYTLEIIGTYDVTCSDDFTLSNLKAKTNQDYQTTITLNSDKINQDRGYSVPDDLTSITVTGGGSLTDYTYIPTENTFSAELTIPKKYITGNITINLTAKELTPLCFTSKVDGNSIRFLTYKTITVTTLQVSSDNQIWKAWPTNKDGEIETIYLNKDEKLYVKNTANTLSSEEGHIMFNLGGSTAASGNINSLINYSSLTPKCFYSLLCCKELISAPALPATTLASGCYNGLFANCTSLTNAPSLPAITLQEQCYFDMFLNCSKLANAPVLPATTNNLAKNCYLRMFFGCASLNYLKVGFGDKDTKDWPKNEETTNWLKDVSSTGTFVWKGSEQGPETRDENTVPSGWNCVSYE